MDWFEAGRAVLALLFVLSLIGVLAWAARRFGIERHFQGRGKAASRFSVQDRLVIDPKRQLVLIRRDETEYVLLLSAGQDLLIDSFTATKASHDATD